MTATLQQTKELTLTIRVVFDGAAGSGKTTAVYALGDATGGAASTPDGQVEQTAWFDWMSYGAGQFKGRSIRVELVTVPGAEQFATRRTHLLAWGDVVVFIADTNPDRFPATVLAFEQLLDTLDPELDVPIVVVANKRDLPGATPIDEVRNQLGLGGADVLVEGIATSGGGVQEAFILAVQAALEASTSRLEATTPEELFADMQAMFAAPVDGRDEDATAEVEADAVLVDEVEDGVVEADEHVAGVAETDAEVDEDPADAAADADTEEDANLELEVDQVDEAAADEATGEEIDADEAAELVVDEAAADEVATGEATADEATGEVATDEATGEAATDEVATDEVAGEVATDEATGDAAADEVTADEVTADEAAEFVAEEAPADVTVESHVDEQAASDSLDHVTANGLDQGETSDDTFDTFDMDSLDEDEPRAPASGPVATSGDLTNSDAPPAMIFDAQLNPDGIADGGAIVLLAEHWRLLVDIANGRTELSLSDSDEAAVALELATWGLIQGEHVTPDEDG